MKYTIEGFRQDKLVEMGFDSADACLLRYILDFYNTGKMAKVIDNGKEYFWLNYQAVIDSMPILGLKSKDSLYRRMKKMVECGLLEHFTKKQAGTFSCYKFTNKLEELLSSISEGTDEKSEGVRMKSRTGTDEKSEQKISLLEDQSIKKINYSQEARELTEYLYDKMDKPTSYLTNKQKKLNSWIKDLDKMLRLDKISPTDIRKAIDYATADDFWKSNILSGSALRRQYDKLEIRLRNVKKEPEPFDYK